MAPWITAELKGAKVVRKGLERLRRKIPLVSRKRMYDAAISVRHIMKQPGKKPTYPIKWDSTKQRKAFFATDGFGGGIPTKRTGAYTKAWTVFKSQKGDGYDIGNPLAHAKFIGGTARSTRRQSKIHRGRWNLFKVAIQKIYGKLPKNVVKHLKITARQEGFRVK